MELVLNFLNQLMKIKKMRVRKKDLKNDQSSGIFDNKK